MSAPSPDFRGLGEMLAREQDAYLQKYPGDTAFRGARPKRHVARWAAAGVAACAAAAAIALSFGHAKPLELTVDGKNEAEGRWISAPITSPVPLRFSDGTEVTLAPETNARVLDVTARGAHVVMESGAAHVSVTPNRGGKWTFTAGPFTVDVKGTRFELAWDPKAQTFMLALVEGSVAISGCSAGQGRPLFAGETLRASCLSNELHIDRVSDAHPVATATSAPTASAPPPSPAPTTSAPLLPLPEDDETAENPGPRAPRAHSPAHESWQSLARASRFKEAIARVNERGFDAEMNRASRDDLMLLGDAARLSGDAAHAIAAYQRVRSRAPGTEAAANAAFSMGRVSFDQREAYSEAAKWFATYRNERPEGALARDAMGRQMEALSRGGDAAAAARLADDYIKRYPSGPHAALARSLRAKSD